MQVLEAELNREGWEIRWRDNAFSARYRNSAGVHLHIGRSFVNLSIGTRIFRVNGQRHCFRKGKRIRSPEEIDAAFVAELRSWIQSTEELTDRFSPKDELAEGLLDPATTEGE